ncbi:MAG: branched-chain amino acid ABC transporter permease [Oscillospiraceae bacterium]
MQMNTLEKGKPSKGIGKWLKWPIVAVVLIGVPVSLVLGDSNYFLFLLCIMGIYVVATSGLDILFGYTGQMSLGHAGFYAIGAYASVLLSHKSFGISQWLGFSIPPLLSIFIAAFIAALFGIVLALPAAKLVYHFLALLTIAFGQLVYLFISSFPQVTNAHLGITGVEPISIFGFAFDTNIKFYFFVLAVVILLLVIKNNIIRSRTGRGFIAIRENQLAANGCGVNVRRYKIVAFAISAFYTGLAGALYVHFIGFISPESFVYAQSVLFLTMLVFGGNGNLLGPILGAFTITIVQEALQGAKNYQMLIYGAFLLVSIMFLPKGIYGLFRKLVALVGKSRRKTNA